MVKCPECGSKEASFEEHGIPNNGNKMKDFSEIRAAVCPNCEALWDVINTIEA